MEADKADDIAQLLQKGLDAYGDGEVAEAIQSWREVLLLEPGNADALDFIETSDGRNRPQSEDLDRGRAAIAHRDVVEEARRLIAERQFEESFELLQRAAESGEFSLDLEATIELVRANLFVAYRTLIGDFKAVPVLAADRNEITKFNLPPDAGFLLSLVDGETDLESLVTVSGMDAFDALRTTKNLIDVGIVRMQT